MKSVKKRTQKPILSPQNSRSFSALGFFVNKTLIWSFLLGLVGLNVLTRANYGNSSDVLLQVLLQPLSPQQHVTLADQLWQNKEYDLAKREMEIAFDLSQNYFKETRILGESTNQVLDRWGKEKQETQKEFDYWLAVIHEKPDYPDAYLLLAVLARNLEMYNESRDFIARAQALDPNIVINSQLMKELETDSSSQGLIL